MPRKLILFGLTLALLFSSGSVFASLYVRGQLGYDWLDTSAQSKNGVLGRLSVGYDALFFGLEFGASLPRLFAFDTNKSDTAQNTSIYIFDALMKLRLSLGKLYVYGGAGAAYLHEKSSGVRSDLVNYHIRPRVAVGAGYLLNPHFAIDGEYSWIPKSPEDSATAYSPKISAIAIGLRLIL